MNSNLLILHRLAEVKEKEEIEREEAAKRETEDYYRKLTEEAEKREERTKWRAKRVELRSQRILFWRGENKKLTDFMRNMAHDQKTTAEAETETKSSKSDNNKVRVEEDEMKNVVIVVEDSESNLVGKYAVDNIIGERPK